MLKTGGLADITPPVLQDPPVARSTAPPRPKRAKPVDESAQIDKAPSQKPLPVLYKF
jgi:hypothetical protein